jgi:hypothetical protein
MDQDDDRVKRAAMYRKMAEVAEELAAIARLPESRGEYLKLAADWRKFADDVEQQEKEGPV